VSAIGLKTAKRTNKLEPVPAHRKHGTDKFPRASSQTRTAYILHSLGMSRFIEFQRPIPSTFPDNISISPRACIYRVFSIVSRTLYAYVRRGTSSDLCNFNIKYENPFNKDWTFYKRARLFIKWSNLQRPCSTHTTSARARERERERERARREGI